LNQDLHAVQQPDASKNYIGLVNDTSDDKRLADSAARSQPRIVRYLLGRLAAMLKRLGKAAPGRVVKS
jgi:hypothetical protein